MSNKIQEFYNEILGSVRCFKDKDEKLWFNIQDIGVMLDLSNYRKTISEWLKKNTISNKDVTTSDTLTVGGVQEMLYATEKVLNRIIMTSRKQEAIELQDWLFDIVMPALRQDGMYVSDEENAETVEEFNALMNEAYERKILRKYGIDVRKDLVSILKENLSSKNSHIYSTATDQLIYKPIFGMTAKQLKQEHNVKSLRDDVFTNEDLVKLAKQEEFVGNLVEKLKDYYKVKEIVYMI